MMMLSVACAGQENSVSTSRVTANVPVVSETNVGRCSLDSNMLSICHLYAEMLSTEIISASRVVSEPTQPSFAVIVASGSSWIIIVVSVVVEQWFANDTVVGLCC